MSSKTIDRFVKASEKASDDQLQHLIILLTPDGRLQVNGSSNFVEAVEDNKELFDRLKAVLKDYVKTEGLVTPVQLLSYPYLPCSPFSPDWKGSGMIRKILSNMLSSIGYGHGGKVKKLGVGVPPLGWPENIPWDSFSGASRSKLGNDKITEIITSMLSAAGMDPATHIIRDEDENGDENRDEDETGAGERR